MLPRGVGRLAVEVGELAGQQLGRWQISVDEAYIRSVRGNVEAAQRKVARVLLRGIGGRDLLDEASVLSKVASRLEELGFDQESVSAQVALLSSFATPNRWMTVRPPRKSYRTSRRHKWHLWHLQCRTWTQKTTLRMPLTGIWAVGLVLRGSMGASKRCTKAANAIECLAFTTGTVRTRSA